MAIKLTEFFQRRPGMSPAAFLDHWQTRHTGVVSAIEGLRRYVQNPAAGLVEGRPNPYDGMVEVWFDDLAAIERIQKSDYWDTIVEDELRFVDRPSLRLFFSEEPLPERPTAGVKRVYLLDPLPGQGLDDFRAQASAALPPPAVSGLLGVQRLLPAEQPVDPAPCAAAVELWRFENLAALDAGMKSDAIESACQNREAWARAREPLTVEERVIR